VTFLRRAGGAHVGHADDEIALEAVRRATAFLPKPYRAAELVRTVREVLAAGPRT
jgi:FixJ family two-component response regulator